MAVSVRTVWDRAAIAALRTDPEVLAYVTDAARGVARALRAAAPKNTGAAADSIQDRPPARAKGARDVGWDKAHYYMSFQNNYATLGAGRTVNPNFQFVQQALDRYIHT